MDSNKKSSLPYLLIALLLGTTVYFAYQNYSQKENLKASQVNLKTTDSTLTDLKDQYNNTLARLDALKTESVDKDSTIATQIAELEKMKKEIEEILGNKNATNQQLAQAKTLINNLNNKVQGYELEIKKLKEANVRLATEKNILAQEKDVITEEKNNLSIQKTEVEKQKNSIEQERATLQVDKKKLEEKIELAKVLTATNIKLSPIKKRLLSGKLAETSKARRVEIMRLNFDIADNRLSESGDKELYIIMYKPDGSAIGDNSFKINNGTEKLFTTKKSIPFVQGQSTKNIVVDWAPGQRIFEPGEYNIEIFHNGYLIGQQKTSLK
jgi:septal ring factor EnvC (AmiA/AmiB activator)